MTRFVRILTAVACGLLLLAGSARAQVHRDPEPRYVPGEVLLRFAEAAKGADRERILTELGARPVQKAGRGPVRLHRLEKLTVAEAVARFADDPALAYLEPNYLLSVAAVPADPRFGELWALHNTGQLGGTPGADIGAVEAWDRITDSRPVLVGVVDTGIDYLHEDLRGNVWVNPGEIAGNGLDDDGNGFVDDVHGYDFQEGDGDPYDENGHGTHVAGTIGAVGSNGIGITGVAWRAHLVALRALNEAGDGTTEDVIRAIEYGIAMGVDILNNSYGGNQSSVAMSEAVSAAQAAGVLFVAAAGNYRQNIEIIPFFPASYPHEIVVSVGASDRRDQLVSTLLWGSNFGEISVDLLAPGAEILSTLPGDQYAAQNGTSMAAPLVSGALALLLAHQPHLSALEAKQVLLDGVTVSPDLLYSCVTSGRLNLPSIIVDPDTIPPAPIDDLRVAELSGDRLRLVWTAPGDDGDEGAADRYELRYSLAPLSEATWTGATPVESLPVPGTAGATDTTWVLDLDFATTYHFGIRAVDGSGNASPLGLAAPVTTLGAPRLEVAPAGVTAELLTGAVARRTVEIRNTGDGPLRFAVDEPLLGVPGRSDGFGYAWSGSDDPDGPPFVWDDIVSTGTLVLHGQDEVLEGFFEIGFEFPFYDRTFTRLWISSNGFITFAVTGPGAQNLPLPSAQAPSYLIAPLWTNLDPSVSGAVFLEQRPDRLILQYHGVQRRGGSDPHTFQVHLLPDGSIEFHYLDIAEPVTPVTVGMQSAAGGPGLQIAYDEDFLHDGQTLRIRPIPRWLQIEPRDGEVAAGGWLQLDLTLDAADLCGDLFTARVPLRSNDPLAPLQEISVEVQVQGSPHLTVGADELDFGRIFLDQTAERELLVRNRGCGDLTITEIRTGSLRLLAEPASLTLPAGGGAIVRVTYQPGGVEDLAGLIELVSDDPDQPLTAVPYSAAAVEAPSLAYAPAAVSDTLWTGQSRQFELLLENRGGSELEITCSTDQPWLTVDPDSLVIPAGGSFALSVVLDADGSCAGVLAGSLTLGTNDPERPESTVPVTLHVRGGPDLELPGGEIDFGDPYVGSTSLRSVDLLNEGCADLTVTHWEVVGTGYEGGGDGFILVAGEQQSVDIRFAPTVEDHAFGQLIVHSDDPDQPSITATLSGTGRAAPRIATDPVFLGAEAAPGQVRTMILGVRNEGADVLRVVVDTRETAWIAVDQDTLSVPAAERFDLPVHLSAEGACGTILSGGLILHSNDPEYPERFVPIHLNVALGADLTVDADTLHFGTIYTGQDSTAVLRVRNRGCLPLQIQAPAMPDPALRITGDLTNLGPGQLRDLQVTWSPQAASTLDARLILRSNDPDEPELSVVLRGASLLPPRAAVEAAGLTTTLLTGARSTGQVTLRNEGGSDLHWSLTTEAGTGPPAASAPVVARGRTIAAADLETLTAAGIPAWRVLPAPPPVDRGANPQGAAATTSPVPLATAGDSLVETFGSPANRYTGDDRSRGNLFRCTTSTTLREHRLYLEAPAPTQMWFLAYEGLQRNGRFDLVAASDLSPAGPASGWFASGQIDIPLVEGRYYLLIASFSSVCSYYTEEEIAGYPVPASFGELILGAGYDWSPATEFPPRDTQNVTGPYDSPVAYYQQLVTGAGTAWLDIDVRAGTLAPGEAVDLAVRFDAAGLCESEYPARLVLETNDPGQRQLVIQSSLSVEAAPDIQLSARQLDFGLTYPRTPARRTVVLRNPGCETLTGRLSLDRGAFAIREGTFAIAPGGQYDCEVWLDPSGLGIYKGTLTIESDDPDEPRLLVELKGESRVAPELVHHPAALVDTVQWGTLLSVPVLLENPGGSDLDYQIVLDPLLPALAGQEPAPEAVAQEAASRLGSILVMESETGQRYYQRALQNLGLDHTFVTSFAQMRLALGSGETWDLIIVNNYADFPLVEAIDDLTAYISSGRRLILGDWIFGDYSQRAIADRMGVEFESYLYEPADFAADAPDHGLFTFPNHIGSWDWTDNQGDRDGQIVRPTNGATALAWYEDYPGAAAIIQNEARNTLFNAFQPVNFNRDSDGDGKLDMVELCENQIMYMVHALDWLMVEPGHGTIPAGGSQEVQVTYHGGRITGGWLQADLRLLSNDPFRPEARVPVTLGLEGVSPVPQSDLPRAFALAGAVPNPFNPVTKIAFDLPRASHVRLKIYDVRGSLVATLLEEELAAGRHSVVWNGRDGRDRQVASGVYFTRIQAGDWQATSRMTLLK